MSFNLSRKVKWAIALVLGSTGAIIAFSLFQRSVPKGAIPVSGGEAMEMILPGIDAAYYAQGDPEWGADKLGTTSDPLRNVGCTISSVAMASTALGYAISPGELNRRLIENGGYTDRGWLIWGNIPAATGRAVEAVVYDQPTFGRIDAALKKGEFPIVKFFLVGGIPHWVMVVGKSGQEYLVHDPSSSVSGPARLSKRARGIYSLRVIRSLDS